MDPATRNGQQPPLAVPCPALPAAQAVLEHVRPSLLLPVLIDIKNRKDPGYLDFFHNRFVPDVKERGVQVPLIAYREGDRQRLIDGMTRYLAALLTSLETVPVLVWPQKPDDGVLPLATLLANSMRLDPQPLELAGVYQQLLNLNDWTQADLARHVRTSAAQVAKVLAISTKLCDQVQALVASGDLSPRAAYALTRLADHQQQAELARKAVDLPMAVESVEEAVNKLLGNGRKVKAKPVKARTPRGLQAIIPASDYECVLVELGVLVEAVRKAQKHSLPLSSLPSLLKGP